MIAHLRWQPVVAPAGVVVQPTAGAEFCLHILVCIAKLMWNCAPLLSLMNSAILPLKPDRGSSTKKTAHARRVVADV